MYDKASVDKMIQYVRFVLGEAEKRANEYKQKSIESYHKMFDSNRFDSSGSFNYGATFAYEHMAALLRNVPIPEELPDSDISIYNKWNNIEDTDGQ